MYGNLIFDLFVGGTVSFVNLCNGVACRLDDQFTFRQPIHIERVGSIVEIEKEGTLMKS